MKLLKRSMFVVAVVCVHISIESADKPRIETLQELRANIETTHALMPELQKELQRHYPNPKDAQAVEVYRLFKEVDCPVAKIFHEAAATLRKNPWLEQQTYSIYEASQRSESVVLSPQDQTDTVKLLAATIKKIVLYKNQLDSSHPQPCSFCKKSSWTRKTPCSKLHKEYQKLSSLLLLADKAAEIESRDPQVGEKYQKIRTAVFVTQKFEETKA